MKSRIQKMIVIALLLSSAVPLKAQWTPINNGIYGGQIASMVVIGSNLFAGTRGGVFLSTNNGASWTLTSELPTRPLDISLVAIGSTLFATGEGVSMSPDNGTTWTKKNTGLGLALNVQSLATDGANLIAGTYGYGVFLSTNNGSSWTAVNSGITNLYILSVGITGSTWFAGDEQGGLFSSINQGISWNALTTGLATGIGGMRACFASIGSNLFAGTQGGVLLSTNNGATWTGVNNGLGTSSVNNLLVNGTTLYAATGSGVYSSTNNGTDWTSMNLNTMVSALAMIGTNLFAGSLAPGQGIFLSTNNGSTWEPVNSGLTNSQVRSLFSIGNKIFAGLDGQGVFFSGNNGASWAEANSGLSIRAFYTINCVDSIGSNIFMATHPDGVLISTNGGANWTGANTDLTNQVVFSLAHLGTNLFAGTWDGGVYLSSNSGTSWTAMNAGLTNTYINSLAVIRGNLFAATRSGVFLSMNSGTSWTEVSTGLTDKYVYALGVIGTNLFASTSQSAFVSSDNGASWTSAPGFPRFNFLRSAGSIILALWDFEINASTDDGASWIVMDNSDLPSSYQFSSLIVHGSDVILGTTSNGVWHRPLSDFNFRIDGIGDSNASQRVMLYPNPSRECIFVSGLLGEVTESTAIDMVGNPTSIKLDQQGNLLTGDIRGLASGMYILKVKGVTKVHQIKFIKP